jgi:DNA-directed RNA polymerase subunit RPC12/RpoP
MICLRCGKENDGSFGSGKFCSRFCANQRVHSKETLDKISKKLSGRQYPEREVIFNYVCVNCNTSFQKKKIKNGRKIVCDNCKRKVVHFKEGSVSLMDLSSRTISKIFKRAKIGCAICGWNESIGDVHHIVEKSNGGTNEISNLIYVCPNHHRIIHSEKKYERETLSSKSLLIQLPNWKDFYNK